MMSNDLRKITVVYLLRDAKKTPLKSIEYKVTELVNDKENHVVKGKTNSKGETYQFIKRIGSVICIYIKVGNQPFKKYNCLKLPNIKKSKLKIRANVSAILIDTNLKEHEGSPGKIKRKDYQVESGDTLGKIAEKFNTNVTYLQSLNPQLESIHKIYIGDWIKIPIKVTDNSDSPDNTEDDQLIPDVDFKEDSGTNQNGNPTEQITYDSDTTVYHIYYDGRIERINKQAVGFARFIYYDEDGGEHDLGKTEYLKTPRYGGSGYVYLVNIGGDEDSSKFGGSEINDNSKNLSAADKEIRLSKYRKGKVGYNIHMNSLKYQRYYLNGLTMASFLGVLCKLGYDDITFSGASKKDGSPDPSTSHKNGECIDVRYLRKDRVAKKVLLQDAEYDHERTLNMVKTFYQFGWGKAKRANGTTMKMLSEWFTNPTAGLNTKMLLPHCSHYNKTRHNNHLHMQGFKPNIKDIDVINRVPNPENYNNNKLDLNRVFEAIVKEEGLTTYMYLDTSKLGNKSKVTIGYGKMIASTDEATKITFERNGKPASENQIKEDWNKVYNSVSGVNTYRHTFFESKTSVRITQETAKQLTIEHIKSDLENAQKRFPGFDQYPVPAQEAILDMSYNLGFSKTGINKFPTFSNLIKNRDFLSAARESNRPQLKESRNNHVRELLEAAATEESQK